MKEDKIRLIDEAWVSEPIRNSFRLTREWLEVNKKFTFSVLGIYIFLNILGAIPSIGLPFMIVSGVFALIIQIYIGRIFYNAQNIKSFISEIEESTVDKLLRGNIAPAIGGYLGWVSLLFIITFIIALFVLNGQDASFLQTQDNYELITTFSKIFIPVVMLMLIFSYVQPLVQSNIIMSHTFKEAFLAVYSIFSLKLWKRAKNRVYFSYLLKLGLILIVALFIFSLLLGVFGMNIFSAILMFIFSYVLTIAMAISSMMLRRVVEE